MTEWLIADTSLVKGGKLEYQIPERPLLHACCNQDHFGTVNLDLDSSVNPDVIGDVREMPFDDDSFAAAFADFPWVESWRWNLKEAVREMLRVAPVAYVMCPWLYGWKGCYPDSIHVSRRPGINHPILFVRYTRTEKYVRHD